MKKSALFVAAAIACASAPALAQTSDRVEERYTYHFDDDDLLGSDLAASGDLVKIRLGPARTLLIRPRTSFVTELQKAVDGL